MKRRHLESGVSFAKSVSLFVAFALSHAFHQSAVWFAFQWKDHIDCTEITLHSVKFTPPNHTLWFRKFASTLQTILSADAFRFFRSTYHLHISLLFRIGFPLEFRSGWIIIHYYSISFRASLTEILRFIIRFLTRPFADTSQWEVLTDTFSSVALSTHLASIRLTRLTNSKLTLR